ncbi:CbtB-domain containing protein [Notoacmeibacter sp. MSK16QG-6]|uniref:CbtB domain-containing protein n=1 Tax=Notoacmeibacter sp. MSK16QG-6 TaxID=2957982 RepID=UPI00209F0705|nr:CbtB-domain containing protein [Notoacmeibacter sp. MSK16QG-6]MCP1198183.1 CbtB-domain containing protein [Notoacmeibacter sp. MSK16QG-6]
MNQNHTLAEPAITSQTNGVAALLLSVVFGFGVIFAVGLAQADALHDAAHDVRHANGFPCH